MMKGNDDFVCSREIIDNDVVSMALAPFSKKSIVFKTP